MKCQILLSGNNKENFTNLSSAELAQRVMKVKVINILVYSVESNECVSGQRRP